MFDRVLIFSNRLSLWKKVKSMEITEVSWGYFCLICNALRKCRLKSIILQGNGGEGLRGRWYYDNVATTSYISYYTTNAFK